MEQAKRKNHPDTLRSYWRFFIPLAFVLCLMVRFPLRIVLGESFWDTMFYGTIVLMCIAIAVHVYRRFGRCSHRFVAVALFCSALATWQIVDMTLLRNEIMTSRYSASRVIWGPFHDGALWYERHPREGRGGCYETLERYIGNNFIAIVYDVDRNAVRMGCFG